jgi:hypothetical protein
MRTCSLPARTAVDCGPVEAAAGIGEMLHLCAQPLFPAPRAGTRELVGCPRLPLSIRNHDVGVRVWEPGQ